MSRAAMLHVVPVHVLIPLCCTSAPTSPTHCRGHSHGSMGKHKTRRRRRRRSRSSSSIRMCASSVREHRAAGKQSKLLLHSECSIGSTSESMAYQQVDTLGQQTPHLASHWEPQPNTIKRRTNRVCQYTAGHVASLEDVNSHSSRWSDSSCAQRSSPASSWSLSGASGSMAHQQLCSGVQQPPEFALQPPMDQQGICHQSMEQPHQPQQALRAPGRQGLQAARRQPQMSFPDATGGCWSSCAAAAAPGAQGAVAATAGGRRDWSADVISEAAAGRRASGTEGAGAAGAPKLWHIDPFRGR